MPPKRRQIKIALFLAIAIVPLCVWITQSASTPRARVQRNVRGGVEVTALPMLRDRPRLLREAQYTPQAIQCGWPLADVDKIPLAATADKALHRQGTERYNYS